MLTCLECAKLRGKPASSRFVEVVSEGVCPDCGRTLSRELMGVRLDSAQKVVLVSSLAVEADIVDGQAKLFRGVADNLLKWQSSKDLPDAENVNAYGEYDGAGYPIPKKFTIGLEVQF